MEQTVFQLLEMSNVKKKQWQKVVDQIWITFGQEFITNKKKLIVCFHLLALYSHNVKGKIDNDCIQESVFGSRITVQE